MDKGGGGKFGWYGQARVVVFFFLFFWTPFFSSAEKIKDKSHCYYSVAFVS